jgi:rhodanese-related sulfurtransferase
MTATISREEIKNRLDRGEPITLVEALPPKYFDHAHLPDAINIPHDQVRELAPSLLPDKEALIAVYCASTECNNSRIATDLLHNLGYVNVREYVDGKKDWIEARMPVESGEQRRAS